MSGERFHARGRLIDLNDALGGALVASSSTLQSEAVIDVDPIELARDSTSRIVRDCSVSTRAGLLGNSIDL